MNIHKGCAWYLLFMAALHTAVGLVLDFGPLAAMVRHGVGAMDQPHLDRLAALWFMFSGALMFVIAGFAFWAVRHVGSLPRFLGFVFSPPGPGRGPCHSGFRILALHSPGADAHPGRTSRNRTGRLTGF